MALQEKTPVVVAAPYQLTKSKGLGKVKPMEEEPSSQIVVEALIHPALPVTVTQEIEPAQAVRALHVAAVVSGKMVLVMLELVGSHLLPVSMPCTLPKIGPSKPGWAK